MCLALPAPAGASVAPGRVTFPLGDGRVVNSVDAFGLSVGTALPDGGMVLAGTDLGKGLVLAQLRADGSLDPSFGQGGIAHVATGPASPLQLLRRPDGRLVVVSAGTAADPHHTPQLVLAGLTPSGALDPSFGQGGIAQTGIDGDCGNCSPAALGADGSIAVAGSTGPFPGSTWVVGLLTPAGTPDPGFGDHGIATLPGTLGYASVLAGGRITTAGQDASGAKLARLLPNGKPDPTWNGGQPVAIPTKLPFPFGLLARADGSVDVLASGTDGAELRRYTTTGQPDSAFGTVQLAGAPGPADLLAAPDGGDLVVAASTLNPQSEPPAERIARVAPDGAVTAKADVPTPFGGGVATFFARHRAPFVTSLNQSGFHAGHAFVRPDGSLVVPGMVNVVQYTGEGVGFEVEQAAVAAIAPNLSLDASFGGAATVARLRIGVPRQRASTARKIDRLAVTVKATTPGPGLAFLTVKAGRHTIARSIAPVLRGGSQRLRALLTLTGRRYLRHRHNVRVSVRATFSDLLAQRRTSTARGTLR
ncbi:MAG TPA: hypothetical protein VFT42_09990 [Solirubrobacteraceae bacterium]|nr:hypothetical protein [Solirubrobacteraceae bacterium]